MDLNRHPRPAVAGPASANAEITIYQDSDGTTVAPSPLLGSKYTHIIIRGNPDQACTLFAKWGAEPITADASLVVANGAGTGDTVGPGFFEKIYRLGPGRNKLTIKAGATPPSASKLAYELITWAGALT